MDISRLLQPLSTFPNLDVVQYYIITRFLDMPTFENAMVCCSILDQEVQSLHHYSDEQLNCIRYMFRDWCYHFIKDELVGTQRKKLFTLKSSLEKPGYLLSSIDFAKINPKENQKIIQFSLSLLIHLPNRSPDVEHKIQAIEQLISSVNVSSIRPKIFYRHKSHWLLLICFCVTSIIILWTLPKLNYPLL